MSVSKLSARFPRGERELTVKILALSQIGVLVVGQQTSFVALYKVFVSLGGREAERQSETTDSDDALEKPSFDIKE